MPDTKAMDLAVSYQDRPGILYRDQLMGVYKQTPLEALPAGATALQALDLDNDGWLDLAFRGAALANRQGKFAPAPLPSHTASPFADLENRGTSDAVSPALPPALRASTTWVSADFNHDGLLDLAAVAPDGSLHVLLNRTATANHWLEVSLAGVKNMLLAPGTEVEVKTGFSYQKQFYSGVPLLFGLRDNTQVDAVRITWPNGLIQNEIKQPANQAPPTRKRSGYPAPAP